MGVTGEIGQHRLGSGKGALGVDDPALASGAAHQPGKAGRCRARGLFAVELQLAVLIKLLESDAIFATEHDCERPDRKKPVRWRGGPSDVLAQPATGHDAM